MQNYKTGPNFRDIVSKTESRLVKYEMVKKTYENILNFNVIVRKSRKKIKVKFILNQS